MPSSMIDEPSCRCSTALPLLSLVAVATTVFGSSVVPFSEDAVAGALIKKINQVLAADCRAVIPEDIVAAEKRYRRRSAARCALDGVVGTAIDQRAASAGEDRLAAGGRVDKGSRGAAEDRLP